MVLQLSLGTHLGIFFSPSLDLVLERALTRIQHRLEQEKNPLINCGAVDWSDHAL